MGGIVAQSAGREVPVAVSAGTLRGQDGQVNGAVFVLRDIRREYELEKMKTEFLATISHELRTPLTPIKGFASILSTRELPREQTKGFADEITSAADQLERIIGQLVNFATIVGGRLSIDSEPIALRPARRREPRGVGGQSRFVVPLRPQGERPAPRVVVDKSYVVQALDELLDNAVKYSPTGGHDHDRSQGGGAGRSSQSWSLGRPIRASASRRIVSRRSSRTSVRVTRRPPVVSVGWASAWPSCNGSLGPTAASCRVVLGTGGTRATIVLPLDGPNGGRGEVGLTGFGGSWAVGAIGLCLVPIAACSDDEPKQG